MPLACDVGRSTALLTLASATLVFSAGLVYGRYTGNKKEDGSESAHCGGTNVSPLADGTEYGWIGGTVEQCKAKCTADPSCNAFVRRDSDDMCHWKTGVSTSTINYDYGEPGHSCYLQKQGACLVRQRSVPPHHHHHRTSPSPSPSPSPSSSHFNSHFHSHFHSRCLIQSKSVS